MRLFVLAPLTWAICSALPVMAAETAPKRLEPKRLEKVEVIAQEAAHAERQQSDAQTVIISEEEIERYGDASVGDVLRRLVGMTFTGPAGVAKDVRMRGLDKGYTSFLLNGEPLPTAKQERQIQVDRFPADLIERIEIIRNPDARIDGAGVAGTINIVLKKNVDGSRRLRVAAGRNGDINTGDWVGQWSHQGESLDVMLTLSHARAGEDIVEEKQRFNADGSLKESEFKPKPVEKTETMLAPVLSWRLGEDHLRIEPFVSEGTEDKTESLQLRDAKGVLSKSNLVREEKDDRIQRLAARYDFKRAGADWHVKAGTQEAEDDKDKGTIERNGKGDLLKRNQERERVLEEQRYSGAGVAFSAGAHALDLGLEWRDSRFDKRKSVAESNKAEGPLTAKAPGANDIYQIYETRRVIYLQDRWQIAEGHRLSPGYRWQSLEREAVDRNGLRRTGKHSDGDASLHYLWAFQTDTNFRASLAETTRLPKFDDLNPLVTLATGAGAGTLSNPDKGGNPALRPEQAEGLEIGIEHFFAGRDAVFAVNVYARDVQDFVQKKTQTEGSRVVERPYNVGDAEFHGLELELRMPLLRNAAHELLLTSSHAEMRGEVRNAKTGRGEDVKDLAPRVTQFGLDYQHLPSRWLFGITANALPDFQTDGVNNDGVREVKSREASLLIDAYIGRRIGGIGELRLLAKNLSAVDKNEVSTKYKANGSFDSKESKIERSEPVITLSFDARF